MPSINSNLFVSSSYSSSPVYIQLHFKNLRCCSIHTTLSLVLFTYISWSYFFISTCKIPVFFFFKAFAEQLFIVAMYHSLFDLRIFPLMNTGCFQLSFSLTVTNILIVALLYLQGNFLVVEGIKVCILVNVARLPFRKFAQVYITVCGVWKCPLPNTFSNTECCHTFNFQRCDR